MSWAHLHYTRWAHLDCARLADMSTLNQPTHITQVSFSFSLFDVLTWSFFLLFFCSCGLCGWAWKVAVWAMDGWSLRYVRGVPPPFACAQRWLCEPGEVDLCAICMESPPPSILGLLRAFEGWPCGPWGWVAALFWRLQLQSFILFLANWLMQIVHTACKGFGVHFAVPHHCSFQVSASILHSVFG